MIPIECRYVDLFTNPEALAAAADPLVKMGCGSVRMLRSVTMLSSCEGFFVARLPWLRQRRWVHAQLQLLPKGGNRNARSRPVFVRVGVVVFVHARVS